MPTSQTIELVDGLEATVELDDEFKKETDTLLERTDAKETLGYSASGDRTMFFTDERPRFTVEITNDSEYDFVEGSQIQWCVAIGEGMPAPVYSGTIDIEICRGETEEYEFGGDLLAFEGHGVVGLSSGGHSGKGDSTKRKLHTGSLPPYSPAYSFSIWDREQYREIHEKTRRAQESANFASRILMVLGFAQLLLFLYQIGIIPPIGVLS